MARSYTQLLYHLVFSTKGRHTWLDKEIRPGVFAYMAGIVKSEGGTPLIINGVADHVHILARLRQDRALADVLRAIKAGSSGWIHDTLPGLRRFAWQSGYSAFTVSRSQQERVFRYIENQEVRHRRLSFADELKALLKKHDIDFDEQYLLD